MQKRYLTSYAVLAGLISTPTLAATEVEQLRQQVETLEDRLNQTTSAVEGMMQGGGKSKTHIGGYGELHYNNIETEVNGVSTGTNKEIDFHRFVLFFNHDFSERVRLHTELELEHSLSGEGKPGEVELEQAYVEFDLNERHSAKGGLFLIPVGILNETHEPPTFYGVERNPIENKIIPTTWWEAGAGLSGELAPGWGYDLAFHSGLSTTDATIRSGRQKVAEAVANDWAMTGRVKYTGIPGTELALAVQNQADIAQGQNADANSATLIETHAVWQRGPFGARALYAAWDIDGAAPKALGKDEQEGYYVEGSYKVMPELGVFARIASWDLEAGNATDTEEEQTNIGLNWWPHPDVVVKFDIESYEQGNTEKSGYNAGIGYQF